MAGVFYDANNVAVGIAALYLQPWTDGMTITVPTDDTPFQAPTAPWISPGGTDQGYSLTGNSNTQDITIEEQAASVGEFVTSKTFQVTGALAESTAVNRALYYGGTIGTDGDGNTTITMSDEPQFYAGYFEYRDASLKTVRFLVPKATVVGTGDVAFRRAADKRMYGIQFTSACTTNEIIETTYDAVTP